MDAIEFELNAKPTRLEVGGERKLLWVLRGELGLTGTKFGCGESLCGACTVIVDREPVRSCRVSMNEVRGKKVVTIEGLERDGKLHPLQQQFLEHGAFQCGFCTPGMIMNAYGLLLRRARPSREEIVSGMDGNLCRCAAHKRILEAIEEVARTS